MHERCRDLQESDLHFHRGAATVQEKQCDVFAFDGGRDLIPIVIQHFPSFIIFVNFSNRFASSNGGPIIGAIKLLGNLFQALGDVLVIEVNQPFHFTPAVTLLLAGGETDVRIALLDSQPNDGLDG
jgi:hypothetical protein